MLNIKKGSSVILKGFTGIKLGVFEVASATEKTATLIKANGDKMTFSLKSGKQTNTAEGKEQYANSIMEDDGSYVAPVRKAKAPAEVPVKKAKTKAPVEVDEDEDEDETPAPSKKKKAVAAPATTGKKKKAKPVVEEDEDDDYEETDE